MGLTDEQWKIVGLFLAHDLAIKPLQDALKHLFHRRKS